MQLVDEVYTFCEDVGLPTTLEDIGLNNTSDSELLIAINKELGNETALFKRLPIKPTPISILESIKMADSIGKKRKN